METLTLKSNKDVGRVIYANSFLFFVFTRMIFLSSPEQLRASSRRTSFVGRRLANECGQSQYLLSRRL